MKDEKKSEIKLTEEEMNNLVEVFKMLSKWDYENKKKEKEDEKDN